MTALAHDALLPRPPGGNGAGAALALVVHAGLVLALTTSIDWRSHTPEIVSAELWASVPQAAAPRSEEPAPAPPAPQPAPPPPPAPRVEPRPNEADIAVERAERRKQEEAKKKAQAEAEAEDRRKRTEAENRRRAEAAEQKKREQQARDEKAEEARLAQQREENLKRMMGQAGAVTSATGGRGTAAQDAAPSSAYLGRLVSRIRREIVFTGNVPDNAAAEVLVRAAPAGAVISRTLTKSSGHKDWDEAVLRAVDKVGTLERDSDGRVPSSLLLVFRRNES